MKLFGKGGQLIIVDILIILVLIAAIALAAVKVLGMNDDSEDIGVIEDKASLEPNVRFTVYCEDVSPIIAKQVIDSLEGEPLDVNGAAVERTQIYYSNSLEEGHFVDWYTVENGDQLDLYLTMEAVAEVYGPNVYAIAWQDIRIGKEFICKTLEIEVTGVVYSVEPLK